MVFRTFGTETREVADSFNAFRRGEHPVVPEPASTHPKFHQGTIAFPQQMGCFRRSAAAAVVGEDGEIVTPAKEVVRLCLGTIDPDKEEPTRVVEGLRAIHDFLEQVSNRVAFVCGARPNEWQCMSERTDRYPTRCTYYASQRAKPTSNSRRTCVLTVRMHVQRPAPRTDCVR